MIHLPVSVRVYLATAPCDMRRSFDELHALVNAVMQLDASADICSCSRTNVVTA
jgi:IS66 Orf2 like protein